VVYLYIIFNKVFVNGTSFSGLFFLAHFLIELRKFVLEPIFDACIIINKDRYYITILML